MPRYDAFLKTWRWTHFHFHSFGTQLSSLRCSSLTSSWPSLLVISIDRLCRLRFASFVHFSLNIAYLRSFLYHPAVHLSVCPPERRHVRRRRAQSQSQSESQLPIVHSISCTFHLFQSMWRCALHSTSTFEHGLGTGVGLNWTAESATEGAGFQAINRVFLLRGR